MAPCENKSLLLSQNIIHLSWFKNACQLVQWRKYDAETPFDNKENHPSLQMRSSFVSSFIHSAEYFSILWQTTQLRGEIQRNKLRAGHANTTLCVLRIILSFRMLFTVAQLGISNRYKYTRFPLWSLSGWTFLYIQMELFIVALIFVDTTTICKIYFLTSITVRLYLDLHLTVCFQNQQA